jgi:hypothetical protein
MFKEADRGLQKLPWYAIYYTYLVTQGYYGLYSGPSSEGPIVAGQR